MKPALNASRQNGTALAMEGTIPFTQGKPPDVLPLPVPLPSLADRLGRAAHRLRGNAGGGRHGVLLRRDGGSRRASLDRRDFDRKRHFAGQPGDGRVADRNLLVVGDEEAQWRVTTWERHQSVRRDGRRVQVVMAGSPIGCLMRTAALAAVATEGRGRAGARVWARRKRARGLRFASAVTVGDAPLGLLIPMKGFSLPDHGPRDRGAGRGWLFWPAEWSM